MYATVHSPSCSCQPSGGKVALIRINNTSGLTSADNYTVHTAGIICNNWHTREGSV